eukprot:TRINITY_DN9381_c0_g2_i1.p3 TRINITY_DN9381_c0_g2~~TRINITY_DN9381_c0_g2_i1.p3  ORF type:complete len:111 (-),score=6.41 TRINITY_DN9381_c0_g2_i1:1218-1550(-)
MKCISNYENARDRLNDKYARRTIVRDDPGEKHLLEQQSAERLLNRDSEQNKLLIGEASSAKLHMNSLPSYNDHSEQFNSSPVIDCPEENLEGFQPYNNSDNAQSTHVNHL